MSNLIQPDFKNIEHIDILKAKKTELSNKIPVYLLESGEQDILKIDFVFRGGTKYQDKSLVASTTNSLMQEGTSNWTASQIAEKFDFYGAYWQRFVDRDFAGFNLYTLTRYTEETLLLAKDILTNALFSEKELQIYLQKQKQQLIVDLEKVSNLARNRFTEVVFGKESQYGKVAAPDDFDLVKRTDILEFYKKFYQANNLYIFVSGKINEEVLQLLERLFGNDVLTDLNLQKQALINKPEENKKHRVNKEGAVQSAIRIGKQTITKKHADYPGLRFVTTLLGGYFGSRLIKNIREDKGYTYGIFSAIQSLEEAGAFVIMSEVGSGVCDAAIQEVYNEITRLQTELVTEDELQLVKNYMMGDLIRSFDGVFSQSESIRSLIDFGLEYDYMLYFIEEIKSITAEKVMQLAGTYLQIDSLYEVVAG